MREFLEDAHRHHDAGIGRAQASARQSDLPKRFYKETGVGESKGEGGGFTVTLDGRPTRTPGRVPVAVPHLELAQLMAAEWAAQGDLIDAQTMPMVRLINSAVESGVAQAPAFREEIVKYAGNDLLLYRADSPARAGGRRGSSLGRGPSKTGAPFRHRLSADDRYPASGAAGAHLVAVGGGARE